MSKNLKGYIVKIDINNVNKPTRSSSVTNFSITGQSNSVLLYKKFAICVFCCGEQERFYKVLEIKTRVN